MARGGRRTAGRRPSPGPGSRRHAAGTRTRTRLSSCAPDRRRHRSSDRRNDAASWPRTRIANVFSKPSGSSRVTPSWAYRSRIASSTRAAGRRVGRYRHLLARTTGPEAAGSGDLRSRPPRPAPEPCVARRSPPNGGLDLVEAEPAPRPWRSGGRGRARSFRASSRRTRRRSRSQTTSRPAAVSRNEPGQAGRRGTNAPVPSRQPTSSRPSSRRSGRVSDMPSLFLGRRLDLAPAATLRRLREGPAPTPAARASISDAVSVPSSGQRSTATIGPCRARRPSR